MKCNHAYENNNFSPLFKEGTLLFTEEDAFGTWLCNYAVRELAIFESILQSSKTLIFVLSIIM